MSVISDIDPLTCICINFSPSLSKTADPINGIALLFNTSVLSNPLLAIVPLLEQSVI